MRRISRRDAQRLGVVPSEEGMVLASLRALNTEIQGCFAWRMETRGIPKRTKTGWKVERNELERGKADTAGSVKPMDSSGFIYGPGISFVIEFKMPGNSLEPHQRQWLQDYVTRGGGRAAVCKSVDEALEFVRAVQSGAPFWRGEIALQVMENSLKEEN